MESVEKYGYELSGHEMDTVAERLERAKRRAKRDEETAFDDEDGDHFFRREQNGREKKT